MSAVDGGQLPAPTSMLIVDVDKFTGIVDTYSHNAGDYVLREVGTILNQGEPRSDGPAADPAHRRRVPRSALLSCDVSLRGFHCGQW
jgi:Diguanylate cyclase, GGDEF domain